MIRAFVAMLLVWLSGMGLTLVILLLFPAVPAAAVMLFAATQIGGLLVYGVLYPKEDQTND